MTRYISTTDTAKMIREALVKTFPGIKFSVRSKSYSGGASVTISWIDGPTENEVDTVAEQFAGATFDPMIDLKSYVVKVIDGERVNFGADFVFCSRNYSDWALITALNTYRAMWGGADGKFVPEKQSERFTRSAYVEFESYCNQEEFYRILNNTSHYRNEVATVAHRNEIEMMLAHRDF